MGKQSDETKFALLQRNVIVLDEEVGGKMVDYVSGCITNLMGRGNPQATVVIMSNGGDVVAGLDIYDIFSTYPAIIEGIVVAYARSMATVILQACTKRLSYNHARIMIHHISRRQISLDVIRSDKHTKALRQEMEETQTLIYKILSQRSGQTVKRVRAVCKCDDDMTADAALKFGLIDAIVPIRKDIVVTPN